MHRPSFRVVFVYAIALVAMADARAQLLVSLKPCFALARVAETTLSPSAVSAFFSKLQREAQYTADDYPTWSATITKIGPLREKPGVSIGFREVTLHVFRVYAGTVKVGEDIVRDYFAPNDDMDLRPEWRDGWEGVNLRVGEKVLIIDGSNDPSSIIAAEPDESHTAGTIRALILLNRRIERDPNVLRERVAALRPNADPLETNYLIDGAATRFRPDTAAEELATLMEKDGFTSSQRASLCLYFGLVWFSGSVEGKARSLVRLIHLAAEPDFEKANYPLNELLFIRSQVHDELPLLNAAVAARLRTNYEKLVARGRARNLVSRPPLNRQFRSSEFCARSRPEPPISGVTRH